jgi:hypothetical protein
MNKIDFNFFKFFQFIKFGLAIPYLLLFLAKQQGRSSCDPFHVKQVGVAPLPCEASRGWAASFPSHP